MDIQSNNNLDRNNSEFAVADATGLLDSLTAPSDVTEILRENKALHGYLVHEHTGPIRSSRQAAIPRGDATTYLSSWIQRENRMDTEIIRTESERNSNYIHSGWSQSAVSHTSPWTSSLIESKNHANNSGHWTTERTVIQRIAVNIPLADLKPNPAFEADVRAALHRSEISKRYHDLYQVLSVWGDVIPLTFDIGISLTITDLDDNITPGTMWHGRSFIVSKAARINTNGGTPTVLNDFWHWLTQDSKPSDWRIVRVTRVRPIFEILGQSLLESINQLRSSIITTCPSILDGMTRGYESWNDDAHCLKTISKVTVWYTVRISGVSVTYLTGTQTNQPGSQKGHAYVFTLGPGEHISDVLVWNNTETVSAIQFMTTTGRISPHYGGREGVPSLLSSQDGVLAGFAGRMTSLDDRNSLLVARVQTIWRHDILQTVYPSYEKYSQYFGSCEKGNPFNDWPFGGRSSSAQITRIDLGLKDVITGIRITYRSSCNGSHSTSTAPYHGGTGNEISSFELQPEEHVIGVSGADLKQITRLCFLTNKGRMSDVFGTGGGKSFNCQPKTQNGSNMRLFYMAGRCGDLLDGLLLVWVPL